MVITLSGSSSSPRDRGHGLTMFMFPAQPERYRERGWGEGRLTGKQYDKFSLT